MKFGPVPLPNGFIRFAKRDPGVPGDAELRELLELILVAAFAVTPILADSDLPRAAREKAILGASALGLMLESLIKIRRRAFKKNFQGIFSEAGLVDTVRFGPLLFKGDKAEAVNDIDDAVKAQKRSVYKRGQFEYRGRGFRGKCYNSRGQWYKGYQYFPPYNNYKGGYYQPQEGSRAPQADPSQGPPPQGQNQGNDQSRGRPWRGRGRGFRGRWT